MTIRTTLLNGQSGLDYRETINDALTRLAAAQTAITAANTAATTLAGRVTTNETAIAGLTAANITFGTAMTTSGAFSASNYGKLTLVTGDNAAITFPTAVGVTNGTLIDLWFTGGAGTANSVAVQAGGRILFAAVSNAWVQMKPFAEGVVDEGGGGDTTTKRAFWVELLSAGTNGNNLPLHEIAFIESGAEISSAGATFAGTTLGDPATQGIANAFNGDLDENNGVNNKAYPHVPSMVGVVYPAGHRPETLKIYADESQLRFKVRWGDPADVNTTGGEVIYDGSGVDYNGGNGGNPAAVTLVYP